MSDRTYDRDGIVEIRPHAHVKVTNPNHGRRGQTGTVVRVERHRIWIVFPDGKVNPTSPRSVEVLP